MTIRVIHFFVVVATFHVFANAADVQEDKADINKRFLSVQSLAGIGGYPQSSQLGGSFGGFNQMGYPPYYDPSVYPPYVPGYPIIDDYSPGIISTIFNVIKYVIYRIISLPLRIFRFFKSTLSYLLGYNNYYPGGYPMGIGGGYPPYY